MPGVCQPSARRSGAEPLGETEAEAHAHGICFKNGPPSRIGVELEWLLHDALDPTRPVAPDRIAAAHADLRSLTLHSALTQEPGGQLELSSAPATSLTACVEAVSADLALVRQALREHRLTPVGYGHDPWRPARRVLHTPRYTAMEAYFDRAWPVGRAMMCSTASVQVCVDAGHDGPGPHGYRFRWRLAHLLGPVLVAAFAHSPLSLGRPTGFRSTRQAVWAALDPGRTAAPPEAPDPRDAWARYALDAPVLCVRRHDGRWETPAGMTFRQWIRTGGRGLPPPTADDLAYHLSTLFPPVRPQGHLELRMIDAQPGDDGWIVPLAVTVALMEDEEASAAARAAIEPLAEHPYADAPGNPLWRRAARHGLADPDLRRATTECFDAAQGALPRLGASDAVREAVAAFAERYVLRGRCPADDLLDTAPADRPAPARTVPLAGKDGQP